MEEEEKMKKDRYKEGEKGKNEREKDERREGEKRMEETRQGSEGRNKKNKNTRISGKEIKITKTQLRPDTPRPTNYPTKANKKNNKKTTKITSQSRAAAAPRKGVPPNGASFRSSLKLSAIWAKLMTREGHAGGSVCLLISP